MYFKILKMNILSGPLTDQFHTFSERDISMSFAETQDTSPFLFTLDFS